MIFSSHRSPPSSVEVNPLVKVSTSRYKSRLKKHRSWPSLLYEIHCSGCDRQNVSSCTSCLVCDKPSDASERNIMLYKSAATIKRTTSLNGGATGTCLNQLPRIDCSTRTNRIPSLKGESSRVSDMDLWLCSMCNHSNTYSVIRCIACNHTKTENIQHEACRKTNDNNNNDRTSDVVNNRKTADCVMNGNATNVTARITPESNKNLNRRSCSDLVTKPAKSTQRYSLVNGEESGGAGARKFSYIGISDPALYVNPESSQKTWICDRCSYAENRADSAECELCAAERVHSECSITVTKDTVRYTPPKRKNSQSLEQDFQYLSVAEQYIKDEWICKKCTLVNADHNEICVVCGGSKIRSLTSTPDTTLKTGEFWSCSRCTLKNTLADLFCVACKTPYTDITTSVQYNSSTGLYTVTTPPKFKSKDHIISSRRTKPLPKPIHDGRKVLFFGNLNDDNVKDMGQEKKIWYCNQCTYENAVKSPSCEMCQNPRSVCMDMLKYSIDTFSKQLSDVDNSSIVIQTHSKMRQQSELMENLRSNEEKDALTKCQQIVQYCKEVTIFATNEIVLFVRFVHIVVYLQNDAPFVDDSFPPAPKSLFQSGVAPEENRVTQWLRPHEISLSNSENDTNLSWTIFRKPLPSDISQGTWNIFISESCVKFYC